MVSSHLMSTAQTFSQVHSILITSNSPCSVRPLLLKLWQEAQTSGKKKKGFVFNLCACFIALQNRGVAEMGKWRVNGNYLTHLRMLSFGRAARKLLTPSSPSWLLDKLGAKRKGVNVLPFLGGVLWQCVCVWDILQIIQVGCLQQDVGQSIHVFTVHGEVGHSGRIQGEINTLYVLARVTEHILVFIFTFSLVCNHSQSLCKNIWILFLKLNLHPNLFPFWLQQTGSCMCTAPLTTLYTSDNFYVLLCFSLTFYMYVHSFYDQSTAWLMG